MRGGAVVLTLLALAATDCLPVHTAASGVDCWLVDHPYYIEGADDDRGCGLYDRFYPVGCPTPGYCRCMRLRDGTITLYCPQ
jgi:hypothetical protein